MTIPDDPRKHINMNEPITVNGKRFDTISLAAKHYGISDVVIERRLSIHWPIDRAFGLVDESVKRIAVAKPIVVNGVQYPSIAEAARAHGINKHTVRDRMAKGIPVDEAFTAELTRGNSPKPIVVNGVRYPSIAEAARAQGVNRYTVHNRMARGVPVDQAFTRGRLKKPAYLK